MDYSLLKGFCILWVLKEPCAVLPFPLQDLTSHAVAEGGGCVEEEGKVHYLSSSRVLPIVHRSVSGTDQYQVWKSCRIITILLLLLLIVIFVFFVSILRTLLPAQCHSLFHKVNFACASLHTRPVCLPCTVSTSMWLGAQLLHLPVSVFIVSSLQLAHSQPRPSLKLN